MVEEVAPPLPADTWQRRTILVLAAHQNNWANLFARGDQRAGGDDEKAK